MNHENSNCFWIYILECSNGSYYTGYTTNMVRRYWQHVTGTADAKYTKGFKPQKIAQCWRLFDNKGTAMKIEYFIKSRNRKMKNILVKDPRKLKKMIFNKLNLDINIFTFNPLLVEKESSKYTLEDLKKDIDPLAKLP